MPRKDGSDFPGKGTGFDRKAVIQSENRKFRKDQVGRILPTFRRTAQFRYDMDNEDSANYLAICAKYMSGAYIADLALAAVKRYHRIGHYDEVVAAQETAFDTYISNYVAAIGNVTPMFMLHDYLSNPPEDESNDTAFGDGTQLNTKVALYSRDTIITELQAAERAGLVRIPAIDEVIRKFYFVVEDLPQQKVGSTFSPGCNYMHGIPWDKLSDWQTVLSTCKTNVGKMKKYCNMFGIPLVPFKISDFEKPYTVFKGWNDPFLDIYLQQMSVVVRDGSPADRTIDNATYRYNTEYWKMLFKDNPNEAVEAHIMSKLMAGYDATYNLWGSGGNYFCGTAQDDTNFCRISQDESSQGAANGFNPSAVSLDSHTQILAAFDAMYEQTNTLNISITGTYLSGDNDIPTPYHSLSNGYYKYGIIKNTILDDIIMEWFADKMNLQNVKKNNFSSVK
jgi:hypothetical protein